jgi:hypothetical protein
MGPLEGREKELPPMRNLILAVIEKVLSPLKYAVYVGVVG